jgi:hypothetical protein
MFGRRRSPRDDPLAGIDPSAAPPRFASAVSSALASRRRYGELVNGLRPGPVRDRLLALAEQLDAGVRAVWDTVQRAAEIERVLATLDPEDVTADYKRAKRSGAEPEVLAAHEARFLSVQRLFNGLDDTDERLSLLEARLGGVVARAAEVAVAAGAGADDLDAELGEVVAELGALRVGLDDLS